MNKNFFFHFCFLHDCVLNDHLLLATNLTFLNIYTSYMTASYNFPFKWKSPFLWTFPFKWTFIDASKHILIIYIKCSHTINAIEGYLFY